MSIEKSLYQAPVGLDALTEDTPDLEIELESSEEDIDEVKDWILGELTEDSYMKSEEVEAMDEEGLRELFEDWKRQGKWDYISDRQESMYYSCEEAIETEDFQFPISKVKKIANKKFSMIENCYPF